ncbi:hypothetical protein CEUSTIGMA_g8660.t1 [Chlamydomonas eustigma]|uniref:Phosphoglycerate dehydrogenase n=1 Tax=Chlamydomonas eustigma TaxID=1157962 RepID=A0A250XDS0_9CHLO|nr:hypothetical protein CEUSTIGMA_g8660.t1 [Chlamydomonas eustigma]|eukprot:GAX81228.1 hypothetical protein CEUSTIGMA_g8660.t1 [Chlamydomonas eustigma]
MAWSQNYKDLAHLVCQVTREVFEASAGRLKVVGRAGVGIDNVDLGSATEVRAWGRWSNVGIDNVDLGSATEVRAWGRWSNVGIDNVDLGSATEVRAWGRWSNVGIDNVDLGSATECGCLVVNAPTANTVAAAEHGIALLCSMARNIPAANASMKAGQWERESFVGTSLSGKTLAVIGFGKGLVASPHAMKGLAASPHVMKGLVASPHVMKGLAASPHAMKGLAASPHAMKGLAASPHAMKGLAASPHVGSEVAKRAKGLGMNVIAYDPYASAEKAAAMGAHMATFEDALRVADFFSLHMPLTPATKNLFDGNAFSKIKRGARIINVARGGVICEKSLLQALESGQVAQAALDVYKEEPPNFETNALIRHPRVICTPHLGASTAEALEGVALEVVEAVLDALEGKLSPNAVNAPMVPAEVLKELQPYIRLAEGLGKAAVSLVGETGFHDVNITYSSPRGDDLDSRLLRAMVIKGILEEVTTARVNLVNADLLARNRGFKVFEVTVYSDGSDILTSMSVSLGTNASKFSAAVDRASRIYVEGQVRNGAPFITKIGNFDLELPVQGCVLLTRQVDQPGIVAGISTLLAKDECNISFMTVGRTGKNMEAIMAIGIDQDGNVGQRNEWYSKGLELIHKGKAGVLLLAGGQGTRLGSIIPKGCYDIGLPSGKSLFQDTLSHFEEHDYFGLLKEQVHFFQQGFLPCLTVEGKIILETPSRIAKAPDGNGGIYRALQRSGLLNKMCEEGVECLDVYCVDNALARIADPLFLGYCHSRGAEVGARVVSKAYPEEKVGVFALRDNRLAVVEYSEIDPAVSSSLDPDHPGELLYNWANICMHYFSTSWLHKDGPVQGIKLELFIFDPFPIAEPENVALVQVERAAQFAPVKNAPGSSTDSPETARAAILSLHSSWVKAAGGKVTSEEGLEVSALISYAGEGLEDLCEGATFTSASSETLLRP